MARTLEIIAFDAADALAAHRGGADSLEIVRDLSVGGLSPDFETLRAIRAAVSPHLNVIIRPHARDFVYTPDEVAVILRDAQEAVRLGADGIVFGGLIPEGGADIYLFRQVADACRAIRPQVRMTFHRAIESVRDPDAALSALIGIADRVLCSGLPLTTPAGEDTPRTLLRDWMERYGDALQFACGGGVTLGSARSILDLTGVPEIHVGGAAHTNGRVDQRKVEAFAALLAS